jgi:hypothetical protein
MFEDLYNAFIAGMQEGQVELGVDYSQGPSDRGQNSARRYAREHELIKRTYLSPTDQIRFYKLLLQNKELPKI